MKKIYFSPSSQPANTYAAGNTNEQEQCRRIAGFAEAAAKRCGFDVKVGMDGTMYTRTYDSNSWGADLHVPIHTNAFNGTMKGTRMFCSSTTGNGGKACKAIFDVLAPLVPGESDGISSASYYEISATKAPCAYVEAAFHDNAEQAKWIIDHAKEIGEAIVEGICNYYGVKYVKPNAESAKEEKPTDGNAEAKKIYRVQVGAFYNRDYAEDLMNKLKALGYSAYIVG